MTSPAAPHAGPGPDLISVTLAPLPRAIGDDVPELANSRHAYMLSAPFGCEIDPDAPNTARTSDYIFC